MTHPLEFIHTLRWTDLPEAVRTQTKRALLDLVGIAAGGLSTPLSCIIRDHAAQDLPGAAPLLFDARTANASAAALANGMTIDSLDGHDGFNPAKGHIGCPVLPAMLALCHGRATTGTKFLETLAMGYEFGARAAMAQHATVPDYHTSGSWGAVTAAAVGARLTGLNDVQTAHALGIAEYHGPRSQMMRCIDHPTMLKDGSGWGAMTGVNAVQLAARGFTGAPAITVTQAPEHWADLGARWYGLEQYYKPYPVCRWAQAPVEGVIALASAHGITHDQVAQIEVTTFHEAIRLATATPTTTEEAQYSTSFPCAVALVRGGITPADLRGDALRDPEILRLSKSLQMTESAEANALFPNRRIARVTLILTNCTRLEGDWMEPKWDHTAPPNAAELTEKFYALAGPVLGKTRAEAIANAVETLPETPLTALTHLLYQSP